MALQRIGIPGQGSPFSGNPYQTNPNVRLPPNPSLANRQGIASLMSNPSSPFGGAQGFNAPPAWSQGIPGVGTSSAGMTNWRPPQMGSPPAQMGAPPPVGMAPPPMVTAPPAPAPYGGPPPPQFGTPNIHPMPISPNSPGMRPLVR